MDREKKLNAKDLINVGIFATIYIIVKIMVGFIGVIPILCVILPIITSFICGPVYMLFLTKVKKFGMITILSGITGLVMFLAGYMWPSFVFSLLFGLLGDLVAKRGNYTSFRYGLASYCIFSLWGLSLMAPIYMLGDAYFAELSNTMGAEFAQGFQSMTPLWVLPLLAVGIIVAALLGGLFGKTLLKKHFVRSGIA